MCSGLLFRRSLVSKKRPIKIETKPRLESKSEHMPDLLDNL